MRAGRRLFGDSIVLKKFKLIIKAYEREEGSSMVEYALLITLSRLLPARPFMRSAVN